MTNVRVGIVSWNTAALLDGCLAALPGALGDLDAEVVVVDNASSDDSAAVAARHPGVRVVANDANVGYARAMNQALAGDDLDVLIALNPDTEPAPGSLSTLVARLLADESVGLVAPRLTNRDGSLQFSAYRFPSPAVAAAVCFAPGWLQRRGLGRRFWLEGFNDHRSRTNVDWVIGAVHVLRAKALPPGPYDERWFMYAEDIELCWALADGGWRRRLEGDVVMPHVGNASGAQAWGDKRTQRWQDSTYDWYARRHGRAACRRYALVNAAGAMWLAGRAALRGAIRGGRSGARAEVRSLLAAAAMHLRAARRGGALLPPRSPEVPVTTL